MLETALHQALHAFGEGAVGVDRAIHNLSTYYDPTSGYAGTLFLGIPDRDPNAITPEDLLAVSTLSMEIDPRTIRDLLGPSALASEIEGHLASSSREVRLPLATSAELETMQKVYEAIKTMSCEEDRHESTTKKWVLAAKLCARKRPRLFPVRDSKVCAYLADNIKLGGGDGQLGWFSRDLQVFAHLIAHPEIQTRLADVREAMSDGHPIDTEELRLLDAVLWMRATEGNPSVAAAN